MNECEGVVGLYRESGKVMGEQKKEKQNNTFQDEGSKTVRRGVKVVKAYRFNERDRKVNL